jgi:ribonuclease HI
VFAWQPVDMPGVPRELTEHKLKVYPQARPIRQKLHRFMPDKREAIRAELARLVAAGFIREVLHPEWLANPVLVLKKNKVDWRMCVDYTYLNKYCLKDPFGLPRIDQVVDSTVGCSMLSFLDCYSGYHQISLAKEDEEKTAFITPFGAFCYTSMSFGLKNMGATYQRAIQTCLADHWGKQVEAYVDDVVITIENSENFIEDLQLVFNSLRRYRWKLNPEKRVFGVPTGKLLGFIVSHLGIEANPEKIKAIMRMEAPRSHKKVQRLTGCMAALSRFISRLGERGIPFYKLLKKMDKFKWTTEAQEALEALKRFLTTPPVLNPPRRATPNQLAEDLLLYISCTTHVVSTTLVVERIEGHTYPVQHLVYFISEVLGPSKMKYPQVQKLLYAVLLTARKLRHYFEDHIVIVVTGFPIGDILHNKEVIGRIAKWACELGAHDIEFRPRTAIKTQALVDFVSEWTEHQVPDNLEATEVRKMYFDGSLKLKGAGAGILFIAPGGEQLKYALQLSFPASSNAAEYEALIHGLNIDVSLSIKKLMVYGDSLVVISQINKDWDCSADSMSKYCAAIRKLEDKFEGLEFHHVERDHNAAANALSKLGSSWAQVPPGVIVQEVSRPSILSNLAEECNTLSQPRSDPDDWREPIIRYIMNEEELDDKAAAERVARQSAHYTLIGDTLYRRGVIGVLMKCIHSTIGKQLLEEIHAGQCGVHAASRTLVRKVFRSGFY